MKKKQDHSLGKHVFFTEKANVFRGGFSILMKG